MHSYSRAVPRRGHFPRPLRPFRPPPLHQTRQPARLRRSLSGSPRPRPWRGASSGVLRLEDDWLTCCCPETMTNPSYLTHRAFWLQRGLQTGLQSARSSRRGSEYRCPASQRLLRGMAEASFMSLPCCFDPSSVQPASFSFTSIKEEKQQKVSWRRTCQ